jgi:hypothetical protein
MWAFIRGDQSGAEDLDNYPDVPRPGLLDRAASNDELAAYALEASIRSAERASEGVTRVQDKASAFLGVLLVATPVAVAATAFAVPDEMDVVRLGALLLAAVGDVFLVCGAVAAALASGLAIGGGLNIARLDTDDAAPLSSLKAAEADAWHYAAMLAFESGTRRAYDLFQARRLALLAVVAISGSVLLSVASGALE